MTNMQPQQLHFTIDGLQVAAQAWGNPEHFPILALHGWLDNSASFFALAPRLNNVYIVAIDMAGHGQTSHRLGAFPYNIWEDVAEIFAVADQLGWQEFALLGHSRGAIIATLAAGTFPERITHLGLIEGLQPEPTRGEDTPTQLALSITSMAAQLAKKRSIYPDLATAIKARERGMFPLSFAAAKALTERGVQKVEGGYHWGTDPRLLAPSAVKLLPEQIAAFITRISCPIALLLASEGLPKLFPNFEAALAKYPKINTHKLIGGHHLHMEQEVTAVAALLNSFFVDAAGE
jgi:pimeloyl-ACP methyl ester carboxylesterase